VLRHRLRQSPECPRGTDTREDASAIIRLSRRAHYGKSVPTEIEKAEVNRPCIVCGSDGSSSELYRPRFFPDVGYPGQFILRRCGCGLIYNSPRLDEAGLAALYDRS
jgi:hypothetical protein